MGSEAFQTEDVFVRRFCTRVAGGLRRAGYKDRLKELGFKFAPKKKAWTWHYGEFSRYHKGEIPIDDIRAKYGSQKVTRQSKQYSLN